MRFDPTFFKKIDDPGGPPNFDFWSELATKALQPRTSFPKTLLVMRPDAIGDFVLFAPTLAGLRIRYAEHRIIFLGMPEVCDLAQATGLVDKTICWDRTAYEDRKQYWRFFLQDLHAIAVDTLLYPCISREANGDEMAAIVPAQKKIALRSDYCNLNELTARNNEAFYNRILIPLPIGTHESTQNWHIARQFATTPKPVSFYTEKDDKEIDTILEQSNISTPYLVLAPGSRLPHKCWPLVRFAEILDWHTVHTNAPIVLAGGPGEQESAKQLQKTARHPKRVVDLTGRLSLPEAAAVIAKAALFIGNDSGLAHLTAAAGTPGHIIMGGGHFGRFFPYPDAPMLRIHTKKLDCFGCNWICTKRTMDCLQKAHITEVDLRTSATVFNTGEKLQLIKDSHATASSL